MAVIGLVYRCRADVTLVLNMNCCVHRSEKGTVAAHSVLTMRDVMQDVDVSSGFVLYPRKIPDQQAHIFR